MVAAVNDKTAACDRRQSGEALPDPVGFRQDFGTLKGAEGIGAQRVADPACNLVGVAAGEIGLHLPVPRIALA